MAIMDRLTFAALLASGVLAVLAAALFGRLLVKAGFPLPSQQGRVGCIDGLRGLLALSVLVHHFAIWVQVSRGGAWAITPFPPLNHMGSGAVALFFMVTGLLFYRVVQNGARRCSWPSFVLGRAFRIVPLVAVSVALVTVTIMARTGNGLDWSYPRAAAQWMAAWREPPLLGYADSGRINAWVLWSLYYEWLFYLIVLPACALAADVVQRREARWLVPATLLVASLGWRAAHLPFSLPQYLPLFAIGMLAAELRQVERIARVLRSGWMALLALGLLALASTTAADATGAAMPAYAALFCVVTCGNSLGGILRWNGALALGECSYGIYLLHGVVLSVLFQDMGGSALSQVPYWLPILLPCSAVVTVGVSAAVHLGAEKPMVDLGKWLARQVTPEHLARLGSNRPA